jgi:hypothetical protein
LTATVWQKNITKNYIAKKAKIKILVPTDFSNNAHSTVEYQFELSKFCLPGLAASFPGNYFFNFNRKKYQRRSSAN